MKQLGYYLDKMADGLGYLSGWLVPLMMMLVVVDVFMRYVMHRPLPNSTTWRKHMDTQIVAVFCMCDDMLKALHHHEDHQCQMSDAEVMTTAIIAALYHVGNFELARKLTSSGRLYSGHARQESFQSPFHRIQDLFLTLFHLLGETWEDLNSKSINVIDSYPVAS